jgi:thiol-disulfide isomerase/thioredoxin
MKKYYPIIFLMSIAVIKTGFGQQTDNKASSDAKVATAPKRDTSHLPLIRKIISIKFFLKPVDQKIEALQGLQKEIPDTGYGLIANEYDMLRGDIANDYLKAGDKLNAFVWLDKLRTIEGICNGNISAGNFLLRKNPEGEAPGAEKRLRPIVDSVIRAFNKNKTLKSYYDQIMPLYVKTLVVLKQPVTIVKYLQPLYEINGNKFIVDLRASILTKPADRRLTDNIYFNYGVALSETGRTKEGIVILAKLYLTGQEPSREMENVVLAQTKKMSGGEAYYQHITDSIHNNFNNKLSLFASNKIDVNGKSVDFAALKGKYVLIDFWGSWCAPCRASHPHLKELYAKYKEKGFEIIGVSQEHAETAEERRKLWTDAIAKDGINWLQVMNNENLEKFDAVKEFGVLAFPTKILLDRDGNIIGRYTGNGAEGEAFAIKLEELLGK